MAGIYSHLPEHPKAPSFSYERSEHREHVCTHNSQGNGSTCGDDAQGEAASLVKILTGDCQSGRVDKTTTKAWRSTNNKRKTLY